MSKFGLMLQVSFGVLAIVFILSGFTIIGLLLVIISNQWATVDEGKK